MVDTRLSIRIDLTSGSMTAAIDRLETRHLLARADHATDRRAWVIHVTPEGKALITKVFAGHQDAMENAMSGLSRAERATLTGLLKRLGTTAEAQFTQEEGVIP
jgi:MarR family 2-MHQ and catechol resistance regulon transcriptional repressor